MDLVDAADFIKMLGELPEDAEAYAISLVKTHQIQDIRYELFEVQYRGHESVPLLRVCMPDQNVIAIPTDEVLKQVFECTSAPPSILPDMGSLDLGTP